MDILRVVKYLYLLIRILFGKTNEFSARTITYIIELYRLLEIKGLGNPIRMVSTTSIDIKTVSVHKEHLRLNYYL